MKICLDHHFPTALATALTTQDHDVITAHERGWHTLSDEELLERCLEEQRTLMTNNVKDFVPIVQRWAAEGRAHGGLIFTDDGRWPRTADTTGRFVDALAPLLDLPHETVHNQIRWL